LLDDDPPSDVREIVAELALLVQRLVDHRASFADTLELDARTAPIPSLVEAVQQHVRQLSTLSGELASLDEGAMVRAIAAADARGASRAERESILLGLDRLRSLEDQRAAIFHRLLEVKALLHRTVNLGLSVHDSAQEHDRQVQLALATLATHSG
jgi:methylmalonyl-CoA mutase N-terminal domain/subunit